MYSRNIRIYNITTRRRRGFSPAVKGVSPENVFLKKLAENIYIYV